MGEKHGDGTPCLEGIRRVPRGFEACCEVFENHTSSCTFDVRYEWWGRSRTWVTLIDASAGGGGVEIRFCPHCGASLSNLAKRHLGKGAAASRSRSSKASTR
jgi:hypothetical protein